MRNSAAILLVIGSLTALYLYNTGRAEAIIQVLKDPNWQKPTTPPVGQQYGPPAPTQTGGGDSGGFDWGDLINTGIDIYTGGSWGAIGSVFGDIFGGLF
jgi:hypothetical protein